MGLLGILLGLGLLVWQDAHRQIKDEYDEDRDNRDSCSEHDISSLFGNRASGRFDDENEAVAIDNLDTGTGW
jgi:hypothetical protein